jgi:long-chain fatty acid transport protein
MQTASRIIQISALALGIAGALAFNPAHASGFQLRENSVKNLGRANAGTAVAKDDASVANTPAAMVNLDKTTVQVDATNINLNATFTGGGKTALGTPLNGGNGGDPGKASVVPALAVVVPMGDLRFGASVSAPFGLKTEYDPAWVGRYNAIKSDVKTVDLTLSAAWAFTPRFSLGAGVIFQRADVTLTNAIDFGTAICAGSGNPANCFNPLFPGPHPQGADGSVEVKGNDNAFGWVVGAQWRPIDSVTIGYSHHSEIDHTLKGNATFFKPPIVNAIFAARGVTSFNSGAIFAPLATPSIDTLSVRWDINDQFRLMGDIQRTGWSSLKNVTVYRSDGSLLGRPEAFNWGGTTYLSVGGEWTMNKDWTFRAGIAHDDTPTKDGTRTPRLPDNTRRLYSVGATWNVSDAFSVDAAYQRISIADPSINVLSSSSSRLTGKFSGHADLVGVSAQYRF